MEFSDLNEKDCDTTGNNETVLGSNETVVYENTEGKSVTRTKSQKVEETGKDEGHYEQLRLDSKPGNKATLCNPQEDSLKRLKWVIFIMGTLVIVLYVAIIALVIVLVVPKAPVDGKWAQWSGWTSCDVTCGNGTQIRTRSCINPVPAHEGADCIGEGAQNNICKEHTCPVTDGGWTDWGNWSACTVTCGGGVQSRTRTCTNPTPSDRGEYCTGDVSQIQSCSRNRCSPMASAFSVDNPSSYSNVNGTYKLIFSHTIYEHGDDFNLSTGTYTCSMPGTYHFFATLVKKRSSSRVDSVSCRFYKSGLELIRISIDPTDDDTDKGHAAISQSVVIHLDKGDTVYLSSCSSPPSSYMEYWSSFTGFLLYHDN